jgi:16S rRNA processing protein RimM
VPPEDFIIVGKLGRTRGVHGEINVTPDTDFPERFDGLKEIYVKDRADWKKFKIVASRFVSGRPVLTLEGIGNPEDASRLTNRLLAVPKSQVVKLPDDTYFIFDLVGCRVIEDGSGRTLGEVEDVEQYPANDVYVIRTTDGRKVLFPAAREFVKSVDIENKKITVEPGGLFDRERS